jgi:hypothetical protein
MTAATFTATQRLMPQRAANPAVPSGSSFGLADNVRPGRIVFALEVLALSLATLWTSVLVCDVLSGAF